KNKKCGGIVVEITRARAVARRLCHRDGSALVRAIAQFGIQPVTGTSRAVPEPIRFFAQRIAALNDEPRYDAVKRRAIVKLHLDEVDEVFNVTRRVLRVKAN